MALGPVILDVTSTELTSAERTLLLHPAVGGVILFSRNIENYEQLQRLISSIRHTRSELLICVDQEGGRVQRCRLDFTRIPPMQVFDRLYVSHPDDAIELVRDCAWLMASELLAVDIDFSFAPVLDVDENFCSVIGDRSFSSDPQRVTLLACAFIDGFTDAGMAVTGKHFPGHGSVQGDSHLELPVDLRNFSEIEQNDLLPFLQLKDRLDAIMPAHILFPQVDASAPVGFSSYWLQKILRQKLAYRGVIFSDDLSMQGAAEVGDYPARAALALKSGCDMVLVCNNRSGAVEVLEHLDIRCLDVGVGDRESMRARKKVSKAKLITQRRWQRTVDRLSALT